MIKRFQHQRPIGCALGIGVAFYQVNRRARVDISLLLIINGITRNFHIPFTAVECVFVKIFKENGVRFGRGVCWAWAGGGMINIPANNTIKRNFIFAIIGGIK